MYSLKTRITGLKGDQTNQPAETAKEISINSFKITLWYMYPVIEQYDDSQIVVVLPGNYMMYVASFQFYHGICSLS